MDGRSPIGSFRRPIRAPEDDPLCGGRCSRASKGHGVTCHEDIPAHLELPASVASHLGVSCSWCLARDPPKSSATLADRRSLRAFTRTDFSERERNLEGPSRSYPVSPVSPVSPVLERFVDRQSKCFTDHCVRRRAADAHSNRIIETVRVLIVPRSQILRKHRPRSRNRVAESSDRLAHGDARRSRHRAHHPGRGTRFLEFLRRDARLRASRCTATLPSRHGTPTLHRLAHERSRAGESERTQRTNGRGTKAGRGRNAAPEEDPRRANEFQTQLRARTSRSEARRGCARKETPTATTGRGGPASTSPTTRRSRLVNRRLIARQMVFSRVRASGDELCVR